MQAELRALADKPYELLLAIDARLQSAVVAGAAGDHEEVWVGLGFRIGNRQLVAPREDVREVLTMPEYTRVPGAKPWLLGVANVRGDLLPIIDLSRMLGGEATNIQRSARVLVFSSDETPAGLLVDEVTGFKRFQPQDQRHEMVPADGDPVNEHLLGAFMRESQLWLAFSLRKLTASQVFLNAAA